MADRIINYARIAKKPAASMTPQDNQDAQDFYDPSKIALPSKTVKVPQGTDNNIWYRPGDILPPGPGTGGMPARLKGAIRGGRP